MEGGTHWRVVPTGGMVPTGGRYSLEGGAHWRVVPTGGRYPLEGGAHWRVVLTGGCSSVCVFGKPIRELGVAVQVGTGG